MNIRIGLLLVLVSLITIANRYVSDDEKNSLAKLEKQLKEELKAITETYREPNHGFIYDIRENDNLLLQVVHSSFIQELNASHNEFGLGIAIAYDETFPSEVENHKKFKQSKYISQFTAYEWDGIPCYALNMNTDYESTARLLTGILKDVYGFNASTHFSTDFTDQGAL